MITQDNIVQGIENLDQVINWLHSQREAILMESDDFLECVISDLDRLSSNIDALGESLADYLQ